MSILHFIAWFGLITVVFIAHFMGWRTGYRTGYRECEDNQAERKNAEENLKFMQAEIEGESYGG